MAQKSRTKRAGVATSARTRGKSGTKKQGSARKAIKRTGAAKAKPTETRRLAISLRPEFVFDILQRKKKVEYRSQPTNIRGRVWLYAARPFQMILGSVEITDCKYLSNEECYGYTLRKPEYEVPPLKPTNHAQPRFWYPWEPGQKPIRMSEKEMEEAWPAQYR